MKNLKFKLLEKTIILKALCLIYIKPYIYAIANKINKKNKK